MAKPIIKTTVRVVPMIYAYTTPEIARHNGWTKIGYAEKGVDKRLKEQTQTADVVYHKEWEGNAIFDDGSGETFRDTDFHSYLRKLGYENNGCNEWFRVTGPESKIHFNDFRANRGILLALDTVVPYVLRDEQAKAVEAASDYYCLHEKGEFLWNAKPRFGKTLAVYDFCKEMGAKKVLVVTNRPAIANSWYSDYVEFLGAESGLLFVSNVDALQGKPYVISRQQYIDSIMEKPENEYGCIEFVSLQDLKGSKYLSAEGKHDKLREVANLDWDLLVIDEAHEGVDTYKTDVVFNHIKRRFTLHLSGTPFKALANDKFPEDAIFNWTYADEQKKKAHWEEKHPNENNPYAVLPQLNMFTYQMSEIVKEELSKGIEIDGEIENYAFDLNAFFETNNGHFVHDSSVDRFLDALASQTKFPFSSAELRSELKHTLWLLNRVDSAKALAKKLENHPVFQEYKIVAAVGDGKIDDAEATAKAYDKVVSAIEQYDKTITLSVGQLTTGVTIPEWTAVLMLSNIKSPSLYMQAAFRAQNPCLFSDNGQYLRKENAYVFDFDPARTLIIFEEFANDLCGKGADKRGDSETRKENVRELLNFFPVIGEDENGEMVALDAEKVLTIPRKIKSQEVVRRGFMSDFLFQNISNVFRNPSAVIDILEAFTPASEPKSKLSVNKNTAEELSLDSDGNVALDEEYVIGKAAEIFGDKIYEELPKQIDQAVADVDFKSDDYEQSFELIKSRLHTEIVPSVIATAQEKYGGELKAQERKRLTNKLCDDADRILNNIHDDFVVKKNTLLQEREDKLKDCSVTDKANVDNDYARQIEEIADELHKDLSSLAEDFTKSATCDIVQSVETQKKEQEKKGIEDSIRDHLRGFSRTIPSFLMAYGSDDVTLENFDTIIPGDVFKEVTSVTLDQFRFLRDGGPYVDAETGEEAIFEGNLFDSVVFNDSVKEFMALKKKLGNYFDENLEEDIFDYIPPQKTNQIFTPKAVVKQMVDMLEGENPGCFDMPDKTFIDLYMKSGLYITEIVKRLYRSEAMKNLYPSKAERLQHIFEKQVYGLAPTEIIYHIALSYILGFDDTISIPKHNLKFLDALEYAKDGTLEQKVDELFGNSEVASNGIN